MTCVEHKPGFPIDIWGSSKPGFFNIEVFCKICKQVITYYDCYPTSYDLEAHNQNIMIQTPATIQVTKL